MTGRLMSALFFLAILTLAVARTPGGFRLRAAMYP